MLRKPRRPPWLCPSQAVSRLPRHPWPPARSVPASPTYSRLHSRLSRAGAPLLSSLPCSMALQQAPAPAPRPPVPGPALSCRQPLSWSPPANPHTWGDMESGDRWHRAWPRRRALRATLDHQEHQSRQRPCQHVLPSPGSAWSHRVATCHPQEPKASQAWQASTRGPSHTTYEAAGSSHHNVGHRARNPLTRSMSLCMNGSEDGRPIWSCPVLTGSRFH